MNLDSVQYEGAQTWSHAEQDKRSGSTMCHLEQITEFQSLCFIYRAMIIIDRFEKMHAKILQFPIIFKNRDLKLSPSKELLCRLPDILLSIRRFYTISVDLACFSDSYQTIMWMWIVYFFFTIFSDFRNNALKLLKIKTIQSIITNINWTHTYIFHFIIKTALWNMYNF